MSLKDYENKGYLKSLLTSKEEIENLLEIVERDFSDSGKDLTPDWQFGIAYNAVLKLSTILIRAMGYQTKGPSHHRTVFQLIPIILGSDKKDDAIYLDSCRRKRNLAEYDYVGAVTLSDVIEIRKFVVEFKDEVLTWLRKNHPNLL